MQEVMSEWELSREKIRGILTDNGSNMIAAFRDWVGVETNCEDVC